LQLIDKERKQLYYIYHDAKRRCLNPNHQRFYDYGGRGIQFKFESFEEWLEEIGPRPTGFEQDRIDNNGHYEKGNVRWVDFATQQKNKRVYKNNTSGVKGVSYVTSTGNWIARCNEQSNGKRRYLYVGKNFEEACSARQLWEQRNRSF
jgi:hypothetical protein